MSHITKWLFGFLAIVSLSFLGAGCHNLNVQSSLQVPGAYHYTHRPITLASEEKPQVFPVYLDQNFTPQEQRDIVDALAQWNIVFNGHAEFQVVDIHFDMQEDILKQAVEGRAFLILRVSPLNRIVQTVDENHNVLGVTPAISMHWIDLVGVRLDTDRAEFISVTMHELGHALGAEHTDGGLMNAYYDPEAGQCIDYKAMVQVADFYSWDKDSLNYCYWDIHAAPAISQ